MLSPAQPTLAPDVGVFYHVAPDVAMAQVMFIGGVIIVMAACSPCRRSPAAAAAAFPWAASGSGSP